MRVRYFYEEDGRIRRISQAHMEGAWDGDRAWDASAGKKRIRVITVVCDDKLKPLHCFQFRVDVLDGKLTEESKSLAVRAAMSLIPDPQTGEPPSEVSLEAEYHYMDWPESLHRQLAVAMDCPISEVAVVGLGGPLIAARQIGLSVKRVLKYVPLMRPD